MTEPKKKPASKRKTTSKTPEVPTDHLTPEQRQSFIDTLVASSSFIGSVRKFNMMRSRVEIPRMLIGSHVMKTPGTPTSVPEFSSVVLVSSKLTMPWTVTKEFLLDNPDSVDGAEARVWSIMGVQASNDIEDLMINGDESSNDNLLKANDGILKLATTHKKLYQGFRKVAVHQRFKDTLKTLPSRYKREKSKLVFLVGPNTYLDYVYEIAGKNTGMSNAFLTSLADDPTYMDIKVVSNVFMPDDKIVLTSFDNIILGIENDMRLRTTEEGAEAVKRDEKLYALHIRCDIEIQNQDAFIMGIITPTKMLRFSNKVKWLVTVPPKRAFALAIRKPLNWFGNLLTKV